MRRGNNEDRHLVVADDETHRIVRSSPCLKENKIVVKFKLKRLDIDSACSDLTEFLEWPVDDSMGKVSLMSVHFDVQLGADFATISGCSQDTGSERLPTIKCVRLQDTKIQVTDKKTASYNLP